MGAIQTVSLRRGDYICCSTLESQPELRGCGRDERVGTQLLIVVSMSCSVRNVRSPHQEDEGCHDYSCLLQAVTFLVLPTYHCKLVQRV